MVKNGFVRNNVNQFAVIYRFLDLLIIQVSLVVAAFIYDVTLTTNYYLIGLIASVAFLFSAEMLWLYRSWRAGSMKEILFVATMSHVLMITAVISWMFVSKTSEDYSRVTISLWFALSWCVSCVWRTLFRQFLFYIRKKGLNSRAVAIIGANGTAERLVKEIQSTPETGYKVVGIYDDRSRERLTAPPNHELKGKIDTL